MTQENTILANVNLGLSITFDGDVNEQLQTFADQLEVTFNEPDGFTADVRSSTIEFRNSDNTILGDSN